MLQPTTAQVARGALARGKQGRKRLAASSVELAMMLPVLSFLFVVSVDYGRVFYYAVIVQNCARNGAYYAGNYSPQLYAYTDLTSAATADAGDLSPAPNVVAHYSSSASGPYTSTTPITNGYVEVNVSWTFTTLANYPGVPTSVSLSRSARMRVAPNTPGS